MTKTLRAPDGIDEASVGPNLYMVNPSDQMVDVRDGDVSALLDSAGFTDPNLIVADITGTARVLTLPGASFSSGGQSYTADADGIAIVQITTLADLAGHGIVAIAPKAPAQTPAAAVDATPPATPTPPVIPPAVAAP